MEMAAALIARSEMSAGRVVLVPGLWLPAWTMIPLARRLTRCGFACTRFGYPWVSASLDDNARRLARFIARLDASEVHLVGHSLGGVLAWYATAAYGMHQVRRIVLAGSPYGGSHAARRLAQWRIGRRVLGRTVPDWLNCEKPAMSPDVEVGVISGTVGVGLGVVVAPDLPRPHDGVITVAETAVTAMCDRVELRVNHASMLISSQVARLVCRFLQRGRFSGEDAHGA